MNERIRQLWRQVELQECDCGCNPDEFLRSKFAQLIVRECADYANWYQTNSQYTDIAKAIKQHFGVE